MVEGPKARSQNPRRRSRIHAVLAFIAVATLTTGYSSCAGTTGPLFAPLVITPHELILRSIQSTTQDAVGLARVDGGEAGDRYDTEIEYGKDTPSGWMTVDVSGRYLTVVASPQSLKAGVYTATVTIEAESSGATGTLQVEFSVR